MPIKTIDKFEALAADLIEFLKSRSPGYCCRVDYLSELDARTLCAICRTDASAKMQFFVVNETDDDSLCIAIDRAVELRNRKDMILTLFIPPDLRAGAAGSLRNSFGQFALPDALRRISTKQLHDLPEEIQTYAKTALAAAKSLGIVSEFERLDYVLSVAANPQLSTCGHELWRLGLIPDLSKEPNSFRIDQNARAVGILTRMQPGKTSSPYDKIESLRLADDELKSELFRLCSNNELVPTHRWQKSFLKPEVAGRLTFERWEFLEVEDANLATLEVEDFCEENGIVKKGVGLKQEQDGQALLAYLGKNSTVKVSWRTTPTKPTGIAKFAVKICSDDNSTLLPEVRVAARSRNHKFSLAQLELSDEKLFAWIEVVALDANLEEIRSAVGSPIAGKSRGFWISQQSISQPEFGDKSPTSASISDAIVEQAFSEKEPSPDITKVIWEKDPSEVVVHFKARSSRSIKLSPILSSWEQRLISEPNNIGSYQLRVPPMPSEKHIPTFYPIEPPTELQDAWNKFRIIRKKLFEEASSSSAPLVESWVLQPHKERIRDYVRSYTAIIIELARQAISIPERREALRSFLMLDTFSLSYGKGNSAWTAKLLAPTHPLRLYWHLAHDLLLRHWASELRVLPQPERASRFSLDGLRRINNLNIPPFLPQSDSEVNLYRDNLTPYWAVFLPQEAKDVPYRLAELRRILRLPRSAESGTQVSPVTIAQSLKRYLDLHPYLKGDRRIRIRAINAGSAVQLKESLIRLSHLLADESVLEQGYDIVLEASEHIQLLGESFEDAFQDNTDTGADLFQNLSRIIQPDFLPKFTYAKREANSEQSAESHIGMLFDFTAPTLESIEAIESDAGSSLELHGLLLRYSELHRIAKGMTSWKYAINLPLARDLVGHPADSKITTSLVDFYRDFIDSALVAVRSQGGAKIPCLKVNLDADQLKQLNELHSTSDWVLTLDPYLGIEYYDSPAENSDSPEKPSERFVLDYVPEFIEGHGQRLILSTSWTDEAARILDQVLQPMGIESNAKSVNVILRTLKSLSGRLALKIASYPPSAKEAISLAIALMVLESLGELKSAFLIPMDPHADLIRQAAKENDSSLLRSDVLLINLSGKQPIFQIIEMKYRSGAEVEQDSEILSQIAEKNINTERALRTLFFPEGYQRVDRHLQLSRISNLLDFYMKRSIRYGHLSIEQGFSLRNQIMKIHDGTIVPKFQHRGIIVCPEFKEPLRKLNQDNNEIWYVGAQVIEAHTSLHTSQT